MIAADPVLVRRLMSRADRPGLVAVADIHRLTTRHERMTRGLPLTALMMRYVGAPQPHGSSDLPVAVAMPLSAGLDDAGIVTAGGTAGIREPAAPVQAAVPPITRVRSASGDLLTPGGTAAGHRPGAPRPGAPMAASSAGGTSPGAAVVRRQNAGEPRATAAVAAIPSPAPVIRRRIARGGVPGTGSPGNGSSGQEASGSTRAPGVARGAGGSVAGTSSWTGSARAGGADRLGAERLVVMAQSAGHPGVPPGVAALPIVFASRPGPAAGELTEAENPDRSSTSARAEAPGQPSALPIVLAHPIDGQPLGRPRTADDGFGQQSALPLAGPALVPPVPASPSAVLPAAHGTAQGHSPALRSASLLTGHRADAVRTAEPPSEPQAAGRSTAAIGSAGAAGPRRPDVSAGELDRITGTVQRRIVRRMAIEAQRRGVL
jgi:hypothetical protein